MASIILHCLLYLDAGLSDDPAPALVIIDQHLAELRSVDTYGIACREIVAHVCDYDHTRIKAFDVRFTSPVYPGETVATDLWVDGDVVSFRCRVPERNVTVLNNGRCVLGAA